MIPVYDIVQGSDEWLQARLGIPTASQCSRILTPGKLALSSQRETYIHELAAEWFTGEPEEDFKGTYWTDRGDALEPEARRAFEFEFDTTTRSVGFVYQDESKTVGCSPDWFVVNAEGEPTCTVELKCPKPGRHVTYLLATACPTTYVPQTQFTMWVTKLPSYFMSYCPGLPSTIKPVPADEKWQAALDTHMPAFLSELEACKAKLRELDMEPR